MILLQERWFVINFVPPPLKYGRGDSSWEVKRMKYDKDSQG